MALVKFKEAYPDYRNNFGDSDAIPFDSFNVYSQNDEQIGSVKDALIDEQEGRFRYLIVDTGFWVFGKKVLLPIGMARFDYDARRIYVDGLTKDQVENLPAFTDDLKVDQDYEESVRAGYRPLAAQPGTQPVDAGTQELLAWELLAWELLPLTTTIPTTATLTATIAMPLCITAMRSKTNRCVFMKSV
jgi:hypothetical protein